MPLNALTITRAVCCGQTRLKTAATFTDSVADACVICRAVLGLNTHSIHDVTFNGTTTVIIALAPVYATLIIGTDSARITVDVL